ncbi:hypothetical protein [Trichocoleus sp. FACHB-262]|uniref:hypothetical protein n=1 Tax=Trichocoleus sp. FACHB-262 TaxID=2692869 RepID=UPI001681D8A9|nr:hypothetical protein [Trichocoleus sp. FACHB-262]MBD2120374.1 hypothetical protein [Trichocoleus sp. FACHB-262]
MKTKVLTVLSATVASIKSGPGWNLVDCPEPSSNPHSPANLAASSSTGSTLLVRSHKTAQPTCYELEKQWLLVQKYNVWQPRCVSGTFPNQQELGMHLAAEQNLRVETTSPLTYHPAFDWQLTAWPTDSHTSLSDTDSLTPCLVLDQAGQYKIRFVVAAPDNHPQPAPTTERADPVIVGDFTITACDEGITASAIALANFTVNGTPTQTAQEPYLFLVAVYAGLACL